MARSEFKESADLDKILAELPIELRGKGLAKAVKKGATLVAKEMRRRAPVESPNISRPDAKQLKHTISVTPRKYRSGQITMALAGPTA